MAEVLRKISAPLAGAMGRRAQTLANHAPTTVVVALAVFGIGWLPYEHFNADGYPKVAHKTRGAAIRHKRSLIPASRASKHLQVYECSHCASWHAGHRGRR